MKYLKDREQKGFTLVELLVTIVVLGIITAMALPLVRKLRLDQDEQKYMTYAQSMEYSAKLYIDSYGEDQFGKRETGCVPISYSELVKRKLLKDISIEDITCDDTKTSYIDSKGKEHTSTVYVKKDGNSYEYYIEAICDGKMYQKGNQKLVKDPDCKIASSEFVYKIFPLSDTSKTKKQISIDIDISNNRGINPYVDIDYWFEDTTGKKTDVKKLQLNVPSEADQKKAIEEYKKTIGNQEEDNEKKAVTAKANVVSPEGLNGEYKLVLDVKRLLTLEGESEVSTQKSGKYILDNQPPSLKGIIETTEKDPVYNVTNPLLSIDSNDTVSKRDELKVCVSIDKDTCGKDFASINDTRQYKSFKDFFGSATSANITIGNKYDSSNHNVYITVSDLAGNYNTQTLPYRVGQKYTITYNINTPREPIETLTTTSDYVIYNDWEDADRTWGVLTSRKKQPLLIPKRKYYDFKEWNTKANGTGTTITNDTKVGDTKDVTVYAQWTPTNYSIKYNLNGGTVNGTNPTTFNYESAAFTLINPTKLGYKFIGWTGTGISEMTKTLTISPGSHDNRTFTANWEPIKYTMEYYNGKTKVGSSVHTYDQAKELTKMSTLGGSQSGYKFYGWTDNNDTSSLTRKFTDGQSIKNLTATDQATLKIYAIWYRDITYNSGIKNAQVTKVPEYFNSYAPTYSLKVPTPASISTWTTLGWRDDTTNGAKEYNHNQTNTTKSPATTYYGVYSRTVSLSYDGNGATGGSVSPHTSNQYYNSNGAITAIGAVNLKNNGFTKTGYLFQKWADGSTSGTQYAQGASYTFNPGVSASPIKKMYAIWEIKKYYFKFNGNGSTGGSTAALTCNYNQNCTLPANGFTKTCHSFTGWATSSTGSKVYNDKQVLQITQENQNIDLYALWKKNSHTVTYDYKTNGGTSATKTSATVDCGNATDLSPTATKSGWTFVGWNTNKNATSALTTAPKMAESNITLYAIFRKEAVTYSAKWNANSASLSSSSELKCTIAAVYNTATQATSCTVKAPTISRSGWTIVGFGTSAGATSSSFASGATLTLNSSNTGKTWYAVTSKKVTTTFDANGGGSVTSPSCTMYNAQTSCTVKTPSTSRSGYTFFAWATSKTATSGGTAANTNISLSGNATYYAIWYTSKRFSAEGSSTYTISGVRAIKSITETEGTASNKSLSGTTYTFKANGEAYTYSYSDTCAISATSTSATPITTTTYYCSNSDATLSGTKCTYKSYTITGENWMSFNCWYPAGSSCTKGNNGYTDACKKTRTWQEGSSGTTDQSCKSGWTSSWKSVASNCTTTIQGSDLRGKSCTNVNINYTTSESEKWKRRCTATCSRETENASTKQVATGKYKCSSGTLVGTSCKTCSQGSYNSSSNNCQYSCTKSATGYSHDITVYYFV